MRAAAGPSGTSLSGLVDQDNIILKTLEFSGAMSEHEWGA